MRIPAFALLLALAATPAAAANVAVADVAAHIGETATVIGVLSNVHGNASKTTFLDFGGVYPNSKFTAVIFKHDGNQFPDLTPLVGKTLAITGKIQLYGDKPEIILKTRDQVQVGH